MKILLPLLSLITLLLASCSQATADIQTVKVEIKGMTCENCVNGITTAMTDLPGMESCSVDLDGEQATITLDANTLTPEQAVTRINQLGFTATLSSEPANPMN